ncbi:hypothetical protein KKB99_07965, partial [bacterium]|nr:hypothetical protein [bacterium]MBU1025927.1 hypothetical protein [bacterium]
IESAYVSAGSDGSVVDATDVKGLVTLDATALINPNEPIYLTAGADGYVMQSDSSLLKNVYVFFLDTLNQPIPASATLTGTVDFNTDDFYAEVFATNMVSATDAILEPSGPGVEDDTFELEIEPLSAGRLYCTLRDTTTNDIISFRTIEQSKLVAENDSFTLDFEYSPDLQSDMDDISGPPLPEIALVNNISQLYVYANNSREYNSSYFLPYHNTSPIDTISSSTSYFDKDFATFIPMSDTVVWTGSRTPERTQDTTLLSLLKLESSGSQTGIPVDPADFGRKHGIQFPLKSTLVMLDVTYEDGSGISLGWHTKDGGFPNQTNVVPGPPAIDSPTDGALGVTLTPTIDYSWNSDVGVTGKYAQLRLVDSANANVWVIKLSPSGLDHSTQLPTLPAELEAWGLTIGNEVLAVIDATSSANNEEQDNDWVSPLNITQSNHSKVYHFIP